MIHSPCLIKEVFETIEPTVLMTLRRRFFESVVPAHFNFAVANPLLKNPTSSHPSL